MSRIRSMFLFLLLGSIGSVWGCGQPGTLTTAGPKGSSAEAGLAIRELVARQLLEMPSNGRVVYVSFGTSWADRIDPPPAFFERLRDADVALRPVSEVGGDASENAVLLVLSQPFWASEVDATVSAVRFRFGAGGADGFSARARWADGGWSLVENVRQWGT